MLDWKKTIQDINVRLEELSTRTPDIVRGEALLAGAGAKTNRLGAKTRELIALAVAVPRVATAASPSTLPRP